MLALIGSSRPVPPDRSNRELRTRSIPRRRSPENRLSVVLTIEFLCLHEIRKFWIPQVLGSSRSVALLVLFALGFVL